MHIAEVRLASANPAALRGLYAEGLGLEQREAPAGTLALGVGVGVSTLVFEPGVPSPQHVAFRIPSAA